MNMEQVVEWESARETEILGETCAICPPQVSHDFTWDRTRAAALEDQWLAAPAVVRTGIMFFIKNKPAWLAFQHSFDLIDRSHNHKLEYKFLNYSSISYSIALQHVTWRVMLYRKFIIKNQSLGWSFGVLQVKLKSLCLIN
jgi:hypothetical protein